MSIFPDSSKTEILYKKDAGFTVTAIGTDLTQENPVSSSKLTWGQFVPDDEPTDLTPMTITQTGNSFVSKSYATEYPYLVKYTMLQLTTTIQPDTSYTIYASDYLDTSTFTNETDVNLLANPITKYGFEVSVYSNSSDNVIRTTSKILLSNTSITWYYDTDNGVLLFVGDTTTLGYGNPFITFWRYEGTYSEGISNEITGDLTISGTCTMSNAIITDDSIIGGMTIVNDIWHQMGETILGETRGDQLGYSVSLSEDGTIVAIGEPFYNDIGRCRIYNAVSINGITTEWEQLGQDITGSTGLELSVSLSGDGKMIAIGEPNKSSGKTYVYQLGLTGTSSGSTGWIKLGQTIPGTSANDKSGYSVSLSYDGKIVAIGAYNKNSSRGQTCVYKLGLTGTSSGSTGWIQLGQNINGEYVGDQSGYSVSLSSDGTSLAIGAIYNKSESGVTGGQCRVYKLGLTGTSPGSTGWIKMYQDIEGEFETDQSGYSVSLSGDGNIVAIGAPYNKGTSNFGYQGQCRVYQLGLTGETGTTGWVQLGQDIDGETGGDYSGWSVSLSTNGKKVAIGAPGTNLGRCRIYQLGLTGGTTGWIQQGQDITGKSESSSGHVVSLSGDGTIVAIGAPNSNFNKGKGYVYKLRPVDTTIDGYVTLDGDTVITGNTIIGVTGTTTTLNGSNLYVNTPMITNYSYGTNGTNVVNSIGYLYNGNISLLTFTSSSVGLTKNGSITSVPPGVYIVSATIYVSSDNDTNALIFTCSLNLGNSSTSFAESRLDIRIDTYFRTMNISGIIVLNAISDICLHTSIQYISSNISIRSGIDHSSLTAVRIA